MLTQINDSDHSLCPRSSASQTHAYQAPTPKVSSQTGICPHNISIYQFRLESLGNGFHQILPIFCELVWINWPLFRKIVKAGCQKLFFHPLFFPLLLGKIPLLLAAVRNFIAFFFSTLPFPHWIRLFGCTPHQTCQIPRQLILSSISVFTEATFQPFPWSSSLLPSSYLCRRRPASNEG